MTRLATLKQPLNYAALFTIIVSMSLSATVSAKVHKWVDEHGRTHYTDTPPPKKAKTSKELKVRKYKASSSPSRTLASSGENIEEAPNKPVNPDAERAKKLESELNAQKDERNKQRCETLKQSKENLALGGQIYEMKNGERKYLSGSEIDAKRKKVNEVYNRDCQ